MTTLTSTAADYARFARSALSRDESRVFLARPFDLRLAAPFEASPLGRYDFCSCDGHRLHAWRADRFTPDDARRYDDQEEGRPPNFFSLAFREGRRFPLFRLPFEVLLPRRLPPRQKHPTHGILFHAEPGAGLAFFRCRWGAGSDTLGWFTDEGELPEGGVLVNGAYLVDALAGMPEEFTLYLPEDPLHPLTFEGDSALALVMPLKR